MYKANSKILRIRESRGDRWRRDRIEEGRKGREGGREGREGRRGTEGREGGREEERREREGGREKEYMRKYVGLSITACHLTKSCLMSEQKYYSPIKCPNNS